MYDLFCIGVLTCLVLIHVPHFLKHFYCSLELVSSYYTCFFPSKSIQNHLQNFLCFQNRPWYWFWPRSVDRAVDRSYNRPDQSTAGSTKPLAQGCSCWCTFTIDRYPLRLINMSNDCNDLGLGKQRSQFKKKDGLPTDCHKGSNGQILNLDFQHVF